FRPLGADDAAWTPVTPESLDVSRLYRCLLPGGGFVDVLFRHAALSHGVAFGALLGDGVELAKRLRAALDDDGSIVAIAVDGETYGHHHRFGEMALAAALRVLRRDREVELVGPAAFRDAHPPAHEVEIIEGTSWSCPHGVERWRADCGCRVAGPAGGSQAWRAPLRQAIDWLRNETAILYETRAGEVLHDPCGARDRYVECVLDPSRTAGFLADEANGRLSPAATVLTRRALELARHALLMQTSCGWFFDELAAEVRVAELATGALSALRVVAVRAADGTPSCQVGDSRFTLASLFGVQREHLVEAVAREGASVARASRHGALARLRTILEPLLAADTPLPLELAMLLGYEAAEEIAAGVAATPPALGPLQSRAASLRARGVVFPARWLARRLAQALEERIVGLPEGAQEALGLLDLAEAAAVVLDLGRAQVRALAWWREAPPAARPALPVTRLCERLRIAPEAPGAAAR